MSDFVIVRTDHGRTEFVSDPSTNGTGGSFHRSIGKARRFSTREAAKAEACENESVQPIDNFLGRRDR